VARTSLDGVPLRRTPQDKVAVMSAVVVYESHWGNTAAIAREIAAGLGPEAQALTTDEASDDAVRDAELIVAGAPVIAFSLPSEKMLEGLGNGGRRLPSHREIPPLRRQGNVRSASRR
jgi:hypothetical protein